MEEDKYLKHVYLLGAIVILSAILVFSLLTTADKKNIIMERETEEKLEVKYQEGIETGRDEVFAEISKDLGTWKAYRLPVKIQDGTTTRETFMILIPPSQCQQFLSQ